MWRSDASSSGRALSCARAGVPESTEPVLLERAMQIHLSIDNTVGEILLLLSLPHLSGPIDLLGLIL